MSYRLPIKAISKEAIVNAACLLVVWGLLGNVALCLLLFGACFVIRVALQNLHEYIWRKFDDTR